MTPEPGTCAKCGTPIEWRRSAKTGNRYMAEVSNPKIMHSFVCPSRKSRPARPDFAPPPDNTTGAPNTLSADESQMREAVNEIRAMLVEAQAATTAELRRELREMAAGTQRVEVSVRGSSDRAVDVGRQHRQFPTLLRIISRRRNVWMAGPAGSGKTSAAHVAAKALSLVFGAMSVGPQTTQSAIFGYMDAHGNYVETEFRRRYEHGGVFLFDEIDRGNPGVLTALNQAIENGACAFPDRMVTRHADFIAIAAANTYGAGASREYVGALQLDAATLDRFVMLSWGYDEGLEYDLTVATYRAAGGTDESTVESWLRRVRRARARVQELSVRHVVSPRASIVGADLLASGLDEETVASCVLWKGLSPDVIARLS